MAFGKRSIFIILLALVQGAANANVKLPSFFSDGMVLQQQSNVNIWGWASPGEKIVITNTWSKVRAAVTAARDGKWQTKMKTPSYGGPYQIMFQGHNSISLKGVLIGEVWFCSGQSNMGFTLKNAEGGKEEIASANNDAVRYFNFERQYGNKKFDDFESGEWRKINPGTAKDFSAVAYFFAKKIYNELHIPVGLIYCAWGGTPAEAWVVKEDLSKNKSLLPYFDRWNFILQNVGKDSIAYNEKLSAWEDARKKDSATKAKKPAEPQTLYYYKRPWREPGVLFNGMVQPFIPFTMKGVLWYQGESNVEYADEYEALFTTLINSWRKHWSSQFPFYFVQMAPHGYKDLDAAARLREAQYKVWKKVPNTAMVATADVGNMKNIHPVQKKQVGERLALIALKNNYGKSNIIATGPEVTNAFLKNNSIIVEFNQPVKIPGENECKGFEIGYKNKTGIDCKPANAVIQNNKIIIPVNGDNPVEVRYAWKLAADGNLFNNENLPAYPFRYVLK